MAENVFLTIFEQHNIQEFWAALTRLSDQEAFYALYRHYYHYLRLIGTKRSLDPDNVKDSINEVFLHIWEQRESLLHIHSPHNYILTLFFRRVFKAKRGDELLDENRAIEDLSGAEISFVEERINQQHNTRIHQHLTRELEQLPHRQREMVYQKFFLGRSYQEIAENLGVSVNTVYNTVYSALNKLKGLLGKPGTLISAAILAFQNFS